MNDMEKKIIINVGRQLGSGGHDIGRMLSMDFAAHYYDRELLNLAAKESGLSEKFLAKSDEHRSIIRSFLHLPGGLGTGSAYSRQGLSQDSFFQLQSDAIRKAAAEHSCVFVGRCADYVLRDMDNVVNVFVTASMDFRIEQVMAKRGFFSNEQKLDIVKAYMFDTWHIDMDELRDCILRRQANITDGLINLTDLTVE